LLLDLAQAYEARQAYPQGIEVLQQLLAADRSNEDAHAGLMRLYALRGQRQQALRQYQTLSIVLQAELEVVPGPGVTELYKEIQSGRFPPAEVHSQPHPATSLDLSTSTEQKKTNNLPLPLTSFIGREKEFGEILVLLKNHRLVTLNGSGGTGKTRLALQVAAEISGRYPDGVWLVELAPLTNPAAVYQAIASVLGLRERINRENSHLLIQFLHGKHLLLVLDNCEHLLDACAWLANELLQACPKLTLLITSREALGIAGETAYRVPSLSMADPNHLLPLEELAGFEAMRLFSDRASLVLPGFNLSNHRLADAARICYRLDGIPLAIELAAARVGVLSVEQIAARLDDRFRLLTGGSRTALPRQRTLRASIDWSYSLLSSAECALFQRLSIFSGGCTLETAEAVCGFHELEKDEVMERLSSLVNKSLIVADHQPKSATRYRMLETIRQYAQEKLADANGASEVRERHLAYYLHLIEEMEARLRSASAPVLLEQLDMEAENLRSALDWAINKNTQEGFEQELRLFIGLWQYWSSRGLYDEGQEWGERGLAGIIARDPRSIEIRARACFYTGWLLHQYSCHQLAWVPYLEESAALYRQTSNRMGLAMTQAFFRWALLFERRLQPPNPAIDCINTQVMGEESLAIVDAIPPTSLAKDLWVKARVLFWIGEIGDNGELLPASQIPKIEEAAVLFRELLDPEGEIQGNTTLGNIAMMNGDGPGARSYYLRALDLARLLKSKNALREVLAGLGEVACKLRDYSEMEFYFHQLQNLTAETSGEFSNIWPQRMLAKAVLFQGDYVRARGLVRENLAATQRLNDPYGSISNLVSLAGVAAHTGQAERAVRLLACLDHQMEDFFKSWDDIDREERQWHLDSLRAQLAPTVFVELWEQGRVMSIEQALSEAQSAIV
jgi:predicted ATPase